MKSRLPVVWMLGCALAAGQVETAKPDAADAPAAAVEVELPDVEACIPAPVKALDAPENFPFVNGLQMAVTGNSPEVQEQVLQGLNHLHGGWEFEASRHFAAAMRADPDCLMAHWGMVMALLTPSPETGPAQNAAARRMVSLLESGKGSGLERGLAYALMKYISGGPGAAALAFRKVAEEFPNDMQAGIFAALFGRGGYDVTGNATPDQEAAEKRLAELVKKFPESPVPLNALLTVRAEAPSLSAALPDAQKLARMLPEYPPYQHLLGHYEWRCGNHPEAASAFAKAAELYQAWMKSAGTTLADCPGWVISECYRIVALVSEGEFKTAYTAAREVATTPYPADRGASAGARMLLWEAKTLPARILLHRGLRGNAAEALDSLPPPAEIAKTRKDSLAYWWIDGLRFALEARRLIEEGDVDEARAVVDAFAHHGTQMAKTQAIAIRNGERSEWTRSFRALEMLASDLRGRLALAGPEGVRGTAYNWYASAADRQRPAPMMLPPMILTPMASRIGDFFMKEDRPQDAFEAYQRALAAFPNDSKALKGLAKARAAGGKELPEKK